MEIFQVPKDSVVSVHYTVEIENSLDPADSTVHRKEPLKVDMQEGDTILFWSSIFLHCACNVHMKVDVFRGKVQFLFTRCTANAGRYDSFFRPIFLSIFATGCPNLSFNLWFHWHYLKLGRLVLVMFSGTNFVSPWVGRNICKCALNLQYYASLSVHLYFIGHQSLT